MGRASRSIRVRSEDGEEDVHVHVSHMPVKVRLLLSAGLDVVPDCEGRNRGATSEATRLEAPEEGQDLGYIYCEILQGD